jgi:hypothetical protein
VAEFPSDEATPLDGTIGSLADLGKEAPTVAEQSFLRVAVFGDAVSETNSIGLADDVRVLVQAFVRDRESTEREAPPAAPTPSFEPDEDIEIAIHGLGLDRDEEDKLHRLIRDLIRERLSRGETEK